MLTGTNQQRCSVILFSLSSRYAAVNPMSRCNNESCRSYKIVRPYRSSCHLTSRSTVDDAAVAWSQIWLEQYQTTRLRLRLDSGTSAARISYTSHMIPWHGGATSNAIWRHRQLHTTHAPGTNCSHSRLHSTALRLQVDGRPVRECLRLGIHGRTHTRTDNLKI